jgi:hypothetical protein
MAYSFFFFKQHHTRIGTAIASTVIVKSAMPTITCAHTGCMLKFEKKASEVL